MSFEISKLCDSSSQKTIDLLSCHTLHISCHILYAIYRSPGLICTDLCNFGSYENQSEDTCDGVFDENEDEVEITDDGLEYESDYYDND